MTEQERELVRKAKREWARQYRAKNPERVRETNERYWLRRALRELEGEQDGAEK